MADWTKIKNEYITGDVGQRKLAEKHGISYSTLRCRAEREQWVKLRDAQHRKIDELTAQKSAEKIANAESEIAAIRSRARKKIWAEIERRIEAMPEDMEGQDFRRIVQNYCDMAAIEPDGGPVDAAAEDQLSRSLRELAEELEAGK